MASNEITLTDEEVQAARDRGIKDAHTQALTREKHDLLGGLIGPERSKNRAHLLEVPSKLV